MDPITDFFIRIKNAYRAKKHVVVVPSSRMKEELARLLAERKYIAGWEKKGRKIRKFIELELLYDGVTPALSEVKRISKSSRRMYLGTRDIKPVRQGFGLLIISTSKGIMSGEDARKARLGGEAIAEVW